MRKDDWLQKLLYLIMIILGVYILYKGGEIMAKSPSAQSMLDSGTVQKSLEDAAMRTYAPGYTATVEERENGSWIAGFMSQAVPVYSYLADGKAEQVTEAGSGDGSEGTADTAIVDEPFEAVTNPDSGMQAASEGEESQESVQGMSETMPDETENRENPAALNDTGAENTANLNAADAENTEKARDEDAREAAAQLGVDSLLREQLRDFNYLLSNYYTVDAGTTADEELLDADTLLNTDLSIEQNPDVPQILIYHTHSQETFADSREGAVEDSIVGMGEVLADHLRGYGYNVIHDTGVYDLVDGVLDRSAAYDYARESIEQILEENPTIEVIIDLHRDGVEGKKFVTEIDGKQCSMIMFFNGISRNNLDEPLYWLENPYIEQNLAFSLQMQLAAGEQYPGFTRNIYLKAERFNLHLRPRSLLIEAGTQLNTVEEEQNAMEPLAGLLYQVLEGQ